MPIERQVTFHAGELGPRLHGRVDLPAYHAGARTLLNWIVTPEGALTKRTGTQHVATFTQSTIILVPFIYTDDDSWIVAMTTSGIVLYRADADDVRHAFESDDDFATIGGWYTAAALVELRVTQADNVFYITGGHVDSATAYARTLTRNADGTWDWDLILFEAIDFINGEPGYATTPFMVDDHGGVRFPGDASHPPRTWEWQVTRVIRNERTGQLHETAPYTLVDTRTSAGVATGSLSASSQVAVYPDWEQKIAFSYGAGTAVDAYRDGDLLPDDYVIVKTRVYRGRSGYFGLIGESDSSSFIDDGTDPDFSDPPPQEYYPFLDYLDEGLTVVENPRHSVFHENRFVMGGTPNRPAVVLCSALGQPENHDEIPLPDDTDPFAFQVRSKLFEEIRGLVSRKKLLIFTSSGVHMAGGSGQNEVMTPTSIAARRISSYGCTTDVPPLEAGDDVFFVSPKGTRIHALKFDTDEHARTVDASILAPHLFDGHSIVSWAFAEDPHRIIWAVRDDGVLLSGTYISAPGGEVAVGWARHEVSGDGLVESVATLPEDSEDSVYLVVNRNGTRTLERLALYNIPLREIAGDEVEDVRYAIYLDRSVSYNGRRAEDDPTLQITDDIGGGPYEGALGTSLKFRFSAAHGVLVGDILQLDDEDGGEPYRFLVESDLGSNQLQVQVYSRDLDDSMFSTTTADAPTFDGDDWYVCTNTVSGLAHLEGETVTALADGSVIEDLVVTAGAVTLGEGVYAAIVHVGLPYDSDFESLAAVHEKGKQKIVERVRLELDRSRGGQAGQSLDDLRDLPARRVSDGYSAMALRREEVQVSVPGAWDQQAYVALRMSDPLPATVVGIAREIRYGG